MLIPALRPPPPPLPRPIMADLLDQDCVRVASETPATVQPSQNATPKFAAESLAFLGLFISAPKTVVQKPAALDLLTLDPKAFLASGPQATAPLGVASTKAHSAALGAAPTLVVKSAHARWLCLGEPTVRFVSPSSEGANHTAPFLPHCDTRRSARWKRSVRMK